MGKGAKRKRNAARLSGREGLERQRRGQRDAQLGFDYEANLRCLWMLDLRSTADTMNFSEEDCCIKKADGTQVYRQVKKNERRELWTFSSKLGEFLKHAYERFSLPENQGSALKFEFYTNVPVTSGLLAPNTNHLNPSHPDVARIARSRTEDFCKSVVFFDNAPQPNPKAMQAQLEGRVRELLEETLGDPRAFEAAAPKEILGVSNRLVAAERKFRTSKSETSWRDVDREVQFESLIEEIRERSETGGNLIPWERVAAEPRGWLPPDAAEAVASDRVISRPHVEGPALSAISDWAKKPDESPLRLVLLAGPHFTGKTWTLMRLAQRIAGDYPNLKLRLAPADSPPEWAEFPRLGMASSNAFVVLIDDLLDSEGWDRLVSRPRRFLPGRTLIVATSSCTLEDSGLLDLRGRFRGEELSIIPIPSTVAEAELQDLAVTIRGHTPTNREERLAGQTTIRHLAEILRGEAPDEEGPAHLAAFVSKLEEKPELLKAVAPVLFCTVVGVAIPRSLLHRHLAPAAIPPELARWLVMLRRRHGDLFIFESAEEARYVLAQHYLSGETDAAFNLYRELTQKSDPTKQQERAFVRSLLLRLGRLNKELLGSLLTSMRPKIEMLLGSEPLWALAFCWLPLFESVGDHGLIRAAVRACPVTPPQTIAEFSLWMEAYGTGRAREQLHARMKVFKELDAGLVVRVARMVRKLGDVSTARKFCHLFKDLPPEAFRESLVKKGGFELLASLLAEHGGPLDRETGLDRIEAILLDRVGEQTPIPSNWIEAYIRLADRTFSQNRNGLSLRITRHLVLGDALDLGSVRDRYQECFEIETQLKLKLLVKFGPSLFEDFAGQPSTDATRVSAPANLLKLVAAWADDDDWARLAASYLSAVEALGVKGTGAGHRESGGSSSGRTPSTRDNPSVSLDVASPFILPAFGAMGRGPEQCSRAFLKLILRWAPGGRAPTEETTKFLFRLLGFALRQRWLPDEVRAMAARALLHAVSDPDAMCAEGTRVLKALFEWAEMGTEELDPNLGVLPQWQDMRGCINTYLVQTRNIPVSEEERNNLAGCIGDRWKDNRAAWYNLSAALLRLGQNETALGFAGRMIEDDPRAADVYGFVAIVEARRGAVGKAYENLRTVIKMYDLGDTKLQDPWVAHWVHDELALVTAREPSYLHRMCSELMSAWRLLPYRELFPHSSETT